MDRISDNEGNIPDYPSYEDFKKNRRTFLKVLGSGIVGSAVAGCGDMMMPEFPRVDGDVVAQPIGAETDTDAPALKGSMPVAHPQLPGEVVAPEEPPPVPPAEVEKPVPPKPPETPRLMGRAPIPN